MFELSSEAFNLLFISHYPQVNLVTGEVEKVNHKERGQTGEQMELDALTSISLPLQKGNNHRHTNPFPKRNTRQGSKSEATERKQSISPSLNMQQVKIQSYHFSTSPFIIYFGYYILFFWVSLPPGRHNLRSFLAANSTQNYFLIARMLRFVRHS